MSTTPNMSLTLPEVLVTSGPTYATQINTALDVVDDHDHSTGKGKKITPSGLNINADLTLANNALTNTKLVQLTTQASVAVLGAIYKQGDDLYYRDGSNNEVRLTLGGNVNVSATGAFTGLTAPASAAYTPVASTFSYLSNATTYAKQSIGDLSVYSRAGAIGTVQAVTFKADVATTAYDFIMPLTSPTANQMIRMDGSNPAKFIDLLGTANQVTVTHNASDTTLSLPQDIDAASSPTFAGLTLTGTLTGTAMNLTSLLTGVDALFSSDVEVQGDLNLTKAAPALLNAGTYDATFNKVLTNLVEPQSGTDIVLNGVVKTDSISPNSASEITMGTIKPTSVITNTVNESTAANGVQVKGKSNGAAIPSGYIGQEIIYSMGSDLSMFIGPQFYNFTFFLIPAGEWEVSGTALFQIDPTSIGSGNATVKLDHVRVGVSSAFGSFDAPQYTNSVTVPRLSVIGGNTSFVTFAVTSAKRRIRVSSSTTYYFNGAVLHDPLSPINGSKFLASTYVKLERVG